MVIIRQAANAYSRHLIQALHPFTMNSQTILGKRQRAAHRPLSIDRKVGFLCWTLLVIIVTMLISSVLHSLPLHFLNNRHQRALESARTMDRVHYDDFVNYVRMVDFCGAACYRTKAEAMRACWDKVRYCRVHFCRFEYEFGRICKPIPGAWLPTPSPRPSPSPTSDGSAPRPLSDISMSESASLESPCRFQKSMSRVGKSMVLRIECSCTDGFKQYFNASSDADVGVCVNQMFGSMSKSLETSCRAKRNDSHEVYDWAFDTSCSKCSGHRPRPTRCNLNV